MNKKLFALLIATILAIVSIGGVYAMDLGSLLGNDVQNNFANGNEVTIDGIRFNVPDGFEEIINNNTKQYNETVDDIPYYSKIKNYRNGNDTINIAVSKNPTHRATDDTARGVGGSSETINGIDGYLEYHPEKVTKFTSGNTIYTFTFFPYYTFSYAKDGKLIVVSASEKEYLSEILIE